MGKLVILRGNSASGKTMTAKAIRFCYAAEEPNLFLSNGG